MFQHFTQTAVRTTQFLTFLAFEFVCQFFMCNWEVKWVLIIFNCVFIGLFDQIIIVVLVGFLYISFHNVLSKYPHLVLVNLVVLLCSDYSTYPRTEFTECSTSCKLLVRWCCFFSSNCVFVLF